MQTRRDIQVGQDKIMTGERAPVRPTRERLDWGTGLMKRDTPMIIDCRELAAAGFNC